MNYETWNFGMGVVAPMPIGLGNMTTNVAASELAPYSASAVYYVGTEFMDPETRLIWRSTADGNQGTPPTSHPAKWQSRGVENRLAMFDASLGTITERADVIEVVITPGRVVTDVALFGVRAQAVQVLVTDPHDGLVFDSGDISMIRPSGNSHWGYFFTPIEREDRVLISGLPAYTQAQITILIKAPGGTARCAECVVGRCVWLGDTRWRVALGYDNWGTKARDPWGGWRFGGGGNSDRMELQVLVHGTNYGRTKRVLMEHENKPVLWIGARGMPDFMTYGVITSFKQVIPGHGISDCQMTIEGLLIPQSTE